MSREIKFRGWNESKKQMFNIDVLAIGECRWDCPDFGKQGVSLAYQPHISVMQYTELKDKNGTEIYEGDILKNYDGNVVVKWDEGYAGFNICYPILECTLFPSEVEVIGNIYQNPELLKQEQNQEWDLQQRLNKQS